MPLFVRLDGVVGVIRLVVELAVLNDLGFTLCEGDGQTTSSAVSSGSAAVSG